MCVFWVQVEKGEVQCWEMTNGGLAFSATSGGGGVLEPRRQVHARRGSKVSALDGVGEESDSCSEASSRSCSFSLEVGEGLRKFTKDGSPEVTVCAPEREARIRVEGGGEKRGHCSGRRKVTRRGGGAREKGRPPRGGGGRVQQQQQQHQHQRQQQQSVRCCSVPAELPSALPSAALCKQYGVYQNDLYTGETTESPHSEEENGNCTTTSLSSASESGTPRVLQPKRLWNKLPGSPYDVEASHELQRTIRRNPLCPFPRRSASPCPSVFSSAPHVRIPLNPAVFSMQKSPMFDKGKSCIDAQACHSNNELKKALGRDSNVRRQSKQQQASKRKLYRGMSAPPVNVKGSSLPPSDLKRNLDVAEFLANTANANGIRLLDYLKPGALGIEFQKALEQGGFINPTKTETQTTSRVPKHMTGKSVLEKDAITTGLWRASILLPGCV